MRKVFLFMMVTLDGFFEGPEQDIGWHNVDEEFNEFAIQQLNELRLMVNPVILGNGTPVFKGIHEKLKLKLLRTQPFRSGNVLLCYQPIYEENTGKDRTA